MSFHGFPTEGQTDIYGGWDRHRLQQLTDCRGRHVLFCLAFTGFFFNFFLLHMSWQKDKKITASCPMFILTIQIMWVILRPLNESHLKTTGKQNLQYIPFWTTQRFTWQQWQIARNTACTHVVFCAFYHEASVREQTQVVWGGGANKGFLREHPRAAVMTCVGYPNNNKTKHSSRLIKNFRQSMGS